MAIQTHRPLLYAAGKKSQTRSTIIRSPSFKAFTRPETVKADRCEKLSNNPGMFLQPKVIGVTTSPPGACTLLGGQLDFLLPHRSGSLYHMQAQLRLLISFTCFPGSCPSGVSPPASLQSRNTLRGSMKPEPSGVAWKAEQLR